MKYVSIDLETTGLDPLKDQILEIGMIVDDLSHPEVSVESLPRFHAYVLPGVTRRYSGNVVALTMNHLILGQIAYHEKNRKSEGYEPTSNFVNPEDLGAVMHTFLAANEIGKPFEFEKYPVPEPTRVIPAGKNFASFDRPFLTNLENFNKFIRFHHRTIDPMMLFLQKGDTEPPKLETCCERSGIKMDQEQVHTALYDAELVIQLIRAGVHNATNT